MLKYLTIVVKLLYETNTSEKIHRISPLVQSNNHTIHHRQDSEISLP